MTGRLHYTPEAERQLNEIDDWIAKNATVDIAQRFISAILVHIEGILTFPFSGPKYVRACGRRRTRSGR